MLSIKRETVERDITIGELFNEIGVPIEENSEVANRFEIQVHSTFGFKKIEGFRCSEALPVHRLSFVGGHIDAAAKHLVLSRDASDSIVWMYLKDVKPRHHQVLNECNEWIDTVENCSHPDRNSQVLLDLQVADVHCFFTNGILSHNSHFLVQLGANALRAGKNVLHYTFELRENKLSHRYDSNLCCIPASDVPEEKDFILKRYEELKPTLGRLIVKEYPTNSASVLTLRSHIEKLAITKQFIPDVVIVDYADIMRSTRQFDSLRYELKLIYEELRGMGMELGIPVWTACFHGDTVISSPSGKFKIKNKVGQSGFPVFAYDHGQGKLVLKTVKSVYKSGEKQELWKMMLDNGREVIVTPNHKLMMRDGSYRELREIKVGDSLMPFNRRMKDGRKQIYLNNGKWEYQYRMVGEWKYADIPKYHQLHHINMDKFNDHPDNIELLTISEHYRKHGQAAWDPQNPCSLVRLRKSYSERMKSHNPMAMHGVKEKMSASRKGKSMGDENPMRLPENQEKVSRAIRSSEKFKAYSVLVPGIVSDIWKGRSLEQKQQIAQKIQITRYGSTTLERQKMCEQISLECNSEVEFLERVDPISLKKQKKLKIWRALHPKLQAKKTDEQREAFRRKLQLTKYGSFLEERVQKHIDVAVSCSFKHEFLEKTRGIPLDMNKKNEIWVNKNHRVVSIEFWGYDDVYNMEVEDLHNYALDAGIVVKNSQSNRESTNQEVVGTQHMAESFAKAMVCDFVITLSRKPLQKVNGLGNLFVAKNRLGKDGILFPVRLDTAMSMFEVLEGETDLEELQKTTEIGKKKLLKDKWAEVGNERLVELRQVGGSGTK